MRAYGDALRWRWLHPRDEGCKTGFSLLMHRREVAAFLPLSRKKEETPLLLGDEMERTLGS